MISMSHLGLSILQSPIQFILTSCGSLLQVETYPMRAEGCVNLCVQPKIIRIGLILGLISRVIVGYALEPMTTSYILGHDNYARYRFHFVD